MATYQIWGRVQRLAPMEFGAIDTAMPDDDSRPQVELKTFGTSQEAYKAVEAMAVEVAARLRREGALIGDVGARIKIPAFSAEGEETMRNGGEAV